MALPLPGSFVGSAPSTRRLRDLVASAFSFASPLTPLLLLIAAISVHDAWLVVLNDQVIAEFERNPLGRWLIDLNSGSVHLFVTVKLIGTSLVCGVLSTLHDSAPRIGRMVTWPIACFQLALLTYLYTF
jgi:hypothetical protein